MTYNVFGGTLNLTQSINRCISMLSDDFPTDELHILDMDFALIKHTFVLAAYFGVDHAF